MVTFTVRSYVGKDGMLKLQVPTGVENVDVDVIVVMQSHNAIAENSNALGYPRFFFEETFGSLPLFQDIEPEQIPS